MRQHKGAAPDKIFQKKSLGQVFLKTAVPLMPMIDQLKKWHVDHVLEIGPGEGILSHELVKAGFNVTAVEKDDRFAMFLKVKEWPHFDIVEADILKFDVKEWVEKTRGTKAIVGNIPYNISTPIVMHILPILHQISGCLIMTQNEFGDRLSSVSDTKDYGSLSVFCQLRANISKVSFVSRNLFNPVPKVDSAIIMLEAKEKTADQIMLGRAEKICRHVFNLRRKKLRNSLKPFLGKLDAECPINLERRPETLEPDEFLQLAEWIYSNS